MCNSDILFKKETFFICNVIEDIHYYSEITTNSIMGNYFNMNMNNGKDRDNTKTIHYSQTNPSEAFKECRRQYWGHKLHYITKNINNNEKIVYMNIL